MARGRAKYPKMPIGVVFSMSSRKSAKKRVKVLAHKYTIDELLDLNYEVPGIPKKANIERVVIGKKLCTELKQKYFYYGKKDGEN